MSYFSQFPSYCRLLVKFSLLTGVPLFNTFVWGKPLNSPLRNLDGQTNGQTERPLLLQRFVI